MKKVIIALFVIVSIGTACHKNNDTIAYDPCAGKVLTTEIQAYQKFMDTTNSTAATHCSGMRYQVTNPGTGAVPGADSYVAVTYSGALPNGFVFDHSDTPVLFPLATLIEGWRKGIPLLKKGGAIILYVPPSMGYGSVDVKNNSGTVIIPANSILIFTIQLVDVQ
ncbi:MAG: FKBP-type peptidyl-prolyl cis-trans isomerase [Chitinophagaceae bacterium]